jgi:hypothetical protein
MKRQTRTSEVQAVDGPRSPDEFADDDPTRAMATSDEFSDETTRPDRPWPGDGVAACVRSLQAIRRTTTRLAAALERTDPRELEEATSVAAAAWFEGVRVQRALHRRACEAREQEEAATQALCVAHEALMKLLEHSLAASPEVPEIRSLIRETEGRIARALMTITSKRDES